MSSARRLTLALSCSFALLAMAGGVTAQTAPAAEMTASRDISGMWWIKDYAPALTPMDGSPVPYTAAGKAAAAKNAAAIKAGTFVDPPLTTCLLPGLPRAMISAYPMKIVQHDRSVTFIHEQTHAFWHAVIGIPHAPNPDDIDSAFMGGESVAQWKGDTLVIDTLYFKAKTFLDDRGMPHGDDLHVTQRLRKIAGGKELEAVMTIEDPAMFTKPWQARRTYQWRPDVKLQEYVCGDPKRVLPAATTPMIRRKAS